MWLETGRPTSHLGPIEAGQARWELAFSDITPADEPVHAESDQPGRQRIDHDRSRQGESCPDQHGDNTQGA
jgi:hypothetical protein